MSGKKVALNLSIEEGLRDELERLARANGIGLSALVRFLATKALADPDKIGLLPIKEEGEESIDNPAGSTIAATPKGARRKNRDARQYW